MGTYMLGIDDVLYKGSIIISLDKDNNIVCSALIKLAKGENPARLANDKLAFIKKYKLIMSKLKKGNKIYIYRGNMYLGLFESDGPYAEEKIFNSFYDSSSLDFYSMLGSLEYSLYNDDVRRKRLVRVGAYYENFNNKD